ncbi:MAG: bifunctional UDP-N-acetylglucosamine diphosphorylase/glucosamine-1-phosphate N-acetyltransferase GlmU [Tissierellia bacterium]|nr:bifunctional UDP-N-acetylglucosamine diphosphorylase/glucosamine-1-phosphate N-acetyltransferase GlmU [Tissierellia bacterium]
MQKVIIMAAGEGTRMKSKTSKVLHKILNKEIISYVYEASKLDNSETIIIGGKNTEKLKEMFDGVRVLEQQIGPDIPYGTGYAVGLARDYIEDEDSVLVLNGDIPLINKDALEDFVNFHIKEQASVSVLSTTVEDPTNYGRIIRDKSGSFVGIVEHRDLDKDELYINEINTGIYIFNGKDLKRALDRLDSNNDQNELYLTDCIKILADDGKETKAYVNNDPSLFYGINNKKELAEASSILRKKINESYMNDGVIIETPEIVSIEPGVRIGKDTYISGNVYISGETIIGEDCTILGSTRIESSKIGNEVKIDNSIIESSTMDDYSDIGPYSHLRPKANIGKSVHIGNFVEVKNASLGEGTKAGHLAYIGDSDLGKNINIGCGVIFVNYDGKFKHRSKVGDNAFVGSNSNIIAPVTLADRAYIAAGSTITRDVDEGELSIERAEQKNIKGYSDKKKKRDEEKLREKK